MKNLLTLLAFLLCFSVAASAQYADSTARGLLKRKYGGMTLDGEKLSPERQAQILSDIGGIDYRDDWKQFDQNRKTGVTMITVGAATAAAGAVVVLCTGLAYVVGLIFVAPAAGVADDGQRVVDNYGKGFRPWLIGGTAATGIGAGIAVAGIPITVKNCRKMNAIVDQYNTQSPAEVVFGPTGNGIGVALRF